MTNNYLHEPVTDIISAEIGVQETAKTASLLVPQDHSGLRWQICTDDASVHD